MEISSFSDLIDAAKREKDPQRLLFLFANAESMTGVVASKHHSGTITPVMCVDKLPSELSTFQALVDEADSINKKWNFIFIASFGGTKGCAPSSKDADPHLTKMSNDVLEGKDLSRYVVLDRKEMPIIIA